MGKSKIKGKYTVFIEPNIMCFVLSGKVINKTDFAVYAIIAKYSWAHENNKRNTCLVPSRALAKQAGVGYTTFKGCIKTLRVSGLIDVIYVVSSNSLGVYNKKISHTLYLKWVKKNIAFKIEKLNYRLVYLSKYKEHLKEIGEYAAYEKSTKECYGD